jgi:hypothetical protein
MIEITYDQEAYLLEQSIDLGSVTYNLRFKKNSYDGATYLDIRDSEGLEVALGVKIVPDVDLLAPYPSKGKPSGTLIALEDGRLFYQ